MRAWEIAYQLKRRAFYERATDTLRLCPENYCLATRSNKKWKAYRDEGATKTMHDKIQAVLDEWQNGSTGDALAEEIGKLFSRGEK